MTQPAPRLGTMRVSDPEHAPGQILGGRYRLESLLGSGGFGVVWAATHLITGKRVALKLLRQNVMDNLDVRRRFVREARAACAINHPNVIQIHDIIELTGEPSLLVMDLLEGETLARKLEREGRVELRELVSIMLPVLSAVSAAHAIGIFHRDLKPENIFLCASASPERGVRVLDFGIAKLLHVGSESAAITDTGELLGSPNYMAPEQVYGERDVDARIDIWALGVILYECSSGVRPTRAANVGQVLKRITTGDLRPLREIAPWLPIDLCELVDGMLRVDRNERVSEIETVRAVLARQAVTADSASTQDEGVRSNPARASRSALPRALASFAMGLLIAAALLGLALAPAGSKRRSAALESPAKLVHDWPVDGAEPSESLAPATVATLRSSLPLDARDLPMTGAGGSFHKSRGTTRHVPSMGKGPAASVASSSASSAHAHDLFAGPD